jgi:NADH:ubiquinone oxidoreductase subunit
LRLSLREVLSLSTKIWRLCAGKAVSNADEAHWTRTYLGAKTPRPQSLSTCAPMKSFLLRVFTWWNVQTFGTQLWTWLYGEFVGEDEFGNRYFRTRGGKIDRTLGFERRWVIFNGYAEATSIPPSWHGWIHHTVDMPPTQENYKPRNWQKPHRPNLTGTPGAWRPTGSTLAQGRRPKATGDYKAWTPER